jgi:hypothetical protein
VDYKEARGGNAARSRKLDGVRSKMMSGADRGRSKTRRNNHIATPKHAPRHSPRGGESCVDARLMTPSHVPANYKLARPCNTIVQGIFDGSMPYRSRINHRKIRNRDV